MPFHPFDDDAHSSDSHSALDTYVRDAAQITVNELLHARSDRATSAEDLARLSSGRIHDLYEDLFAHLVIPSTTIPTVPGPEILRDARPIAPSRALTQSWIESKNDVAHQKSEQSRSTKISPPPSLDSREPSLTDTSLCTDELIRSRVYQTVLQGENGDSVPLRMVVPSSRIGISEYEMAVAPTDASCGEEYTSGDGDMTTDPSRPGLRCAFWFLNCRRGFHDIERWLTHCNAHLQNRNDQRPVPCQMCGNVFEGWNRWLLHIADHQREGVNLKKLGADPALVPRLWGAKIIRDSEWLEIIEKGRLNSRGRNYAHMHNPVRERRQLAAREGRG
ncbi:hypothetical protein ANO11243_025820 [Dothideomycetidae sp. 11243]|nr:hypothetical protein ANO11243_025820 [fungal sp. No.11243]